jgi:hypothetical protein
MVPLTHAVSQQWLNADWYAFWSSAWGEGVKDVLILGVLGYVGKRIHSKLHTHFECEAPGCSEWGHPIEGTSHRACKPHHPHLSPEGHSPEEMAHVAKHGHNGQAYVTPADSILPT